VKECTDAGARVILLAVWPASQPSLLRLPVWDASAVAQTLSELNARLGQLHAPERGVVVIDLFAEAHASPHYRDTLHLTPETYAALTTVLLRKVAESRSPKTP
jgi:hypothetical protein